MTHRTNTAQNAHLSWKLENATESYEQGSTKLKGQLAPTVGTEKGTAAVLTCPLHELQFFDKRATRYKSTVCEMGGLINPGLRAGLEPGAALFSLGPWHNTAG